MAAGFLGVDFLYRLIYNRYMNEENLKKNIAKKLAFYRKNAGLTQSELAEKISYSDKSISKWERGEGLPDVAVLVTLSELFGVSLDDFINDKAPKKPIKALKKYTLIPLLSVGVAWLCATFVYFVLMLVMPDVPRLWLSFIYACPVSFIILVVFSSMWWKMIFQIFSVSGLIWTIAVSLDITFSLKYMYLIYVVAAVLQVLAILWYVLIYDRDKSRVSKSKSIKNDRGSL